MASHPRQRIYHTYWYLFCQKPFSFSVPKLGLVTRRKSRDETRSRRRVTRRDETRDGLALFVSRPKVTRRDKIRDTVHKNFFSIIQNPIFCTFEVTLCARDQKYFARWSRKTESRDEMRSRWSSLVSSRLFSRRDRLVTGPSLNEGQHIWRVSA